MTRFAVGDYVEIVTDANQIIGDSVRPGMRGIILKYLGRDIMIGGVYGVQGDAWLVDFTEDHAVCSSHGIRKVPPDPGRLLTSWDTVPWVPQRSTT
jgi:hypothetical protein